MWFSIVFFTIFGALIAGFLWETHKKRMLRHHSRAGMRSVGMGRAGHTGHYGAHGDSNSGFSGDCGFGGGGGGGGGDGGGGGGGC